MPKRDYKSYNILEEELAQEAVEMEQNAQIEETRLDEKNSQLTGKNDKMEVNVEIEKVKPINEVKAEIVQEEDKKELNKQAINQMSAEPKEKEIKAKPISLVKVNLGAKKEVQKETSVKQQEAKDKSVTSIKKEENVDFPAYKRYYQQKERSSLFKGIMGLAKLIILIMLLPFIGIIAAGVLGVVGCVALVVLGSIGTGLFILGMICFMATQFNVEIIALGISSSATLISFGGIIFILFMMFAKWLIGLCKGYWKPRRMKTKESK